MSVVKSQKRAAVLEAVQRCTSGDFEGEIDKILKEMQVLHQLQDNLFNLYYPEQAVSYNTASCMLKATR